MITDNPIYDAERYAAEREAELEKLPVCHECGYNIQQESAVYIDGKWYCDNCLRELRKGIA